MVFLIDSFSYFLTLIYTVSAMGDEKDAFYVVRKGDVIGVYKSFADCQAQAGFSVIIFSVLFLVFKNLH